MNIIELCKKIKDSDKCSSCGGTHIGFGCKYCGAKNQELENLEQQLLEIITKNTEFSQKDLVALNSIKSLEIPTIMHVLTNECITKIHEYYNSILEKSKNNLTSVDDDSLILMYLKLNFYPKNNDYFMTYLMKKLVLNRLELSLTEKKELIIFFTERVMTGKIKNSKCTFDEKEENVAGSAFLNKIYLNEGVVEELLNKSQYLEVLQLVFHESAHTYQHKQMYIDKSLNFFNLLRTKDILLSRYIDKYYDTNYLKVSHEVEARYCQAAFTLRYLESLGLPLDKDTIKYLQNEITKTESEFRDLSREYNGKTYHIDEIFENMQIKPADLEHFPVLKIQYKIVDGKIVPKTLDELKLEKENLVAKNRLTAAPQAELVELYKEVIAEVSNKKSTEKQV